MGSVEKLMFWFCILVTFILVSLWIYQATTGTGGQNV